MATINGTSVGGMTLQADYSYTQNASANTSTVTVTLKLINHYALYATAISGSYISVGGNKSNYSKSISYGGSTTTSTTLATKTVTVTHNSDGTAKCNIAGTFIMNGTYRDSYVGTMSVNSTITLPTIPRSSSFTAPTSINTGATLSGTVSPSSTAFNHKVIIKVGSSTKNTISLAAGTTAFSDVVEHSWFPSSTSGTITLVLETYNGTTKIATTSMSVTANVPASIVPSVSALTAALVDGKGGHYVQNKSKVKLTATATAGSGASIKSYAFSGSNMSASGTANNATSSVLQYSGARTYTVTVTDTRGRTATKTVSITVQPYAAPAISSMSVQRCTSNGTIDENGTYAYVTVNSTYSSIGGANTRTVVLTNSGNSTATTILATTNTNGTWSGVYVSGFATGTTYTITATIKDTAYSSTATKSGTLKAAARPMNIKSNGKGIAFGKMSETDNLLDVAWNEKVRENLTVDKNLSVTGTINEAVINRNNYITGGAVTNLPSHNSVADRPTFLGSYTVGDTWYNTISVRHRNGLTDGTSYGMQIIAPLTGFGSLQWRQQNNNVWNDFKTILDTANTADYVVEQGTVGIWTYRKWFSGFAECWGNLSTTPTAANGNNRIATNLPFTFANTGYLVHVTPAKASMYIDACGDSETNGTITHTTTSFTIAYKYSFTTLYSVSFNLYVTGQWK